MGKVFQDGIREGEDGAAGWYTKTSPVFEVVPGLHDWLVNTCFVGDLLLPTRQDQVVLEIFEICSDNNIHGVLPVMDTLWDHLWTYSLACD